MMLPRLTHFMDSFPDIVRVATGRLKPANLYLATVQKMGVTSWLCTITCISKPNLLSPR